MIRADISPATLAKLLEQIDLLFLSEIERLELDGWLRTELRRHKRIEFVPDEADDATWLIDGYPYQVPRRSTVLWAFWMALRDGEARAEWLGMSANSMRNARQRIARWLEAHGHHTLSAEVLRVSVADDGAMRYPRRPGAPVIVFDA